MWYIKFLKTYVLCGHQECMEPLKSVVYTNNGLNREWKRNINDEWKHCFKDWTRAISLLITIAAHLQFNNCRFKIYVPLKYKVR